MKTRHIILMGMLSFSTLSCEYDSTDDIIADIPVGEVIGYANHVRPIMENNCVSCHADTPLFGAPMPLTSYETVRNAVERRELLTRINLPEGHDELMPLGGPKLPESTIATLEQWAASGFSE